MRKLFILLTFFCLGSTAWSQLRMVSGQVVNQENGEALGGVSVTIKGTKYGTTTNDQGGFTIDFPSRKSAVLVFNHVGFTAQEVSVQNETSLMIKLAGYAENLNELVVIGYGRQKKASLTTAVGSVEGKSIAERGTVNPMQAVQGQVAGVDINSTSGRAGVANYNVVIRGQNSLASGQPLFVVDGVIVDNINFLNPQDITSMDILKDAASTAIYGSRGSNGVILVTTKLAENAKGAPVVSLDSYLGVRKVARMPNFMSGDDQALLLRNSFITNGIIDGTPYDANSWARGNSELVRRYAQHDYTDWRSKVLQTGAQQNHWLTVSGTSKNIRYLIGAGYQNEKGNLVQEALEKYNFKASVEARINDHWMAGMNLNFATSTLQQGSPTAIQNAFRQNPLFAYRDIKDGSVAVMPGEIWDPVNQNYTGYGSFINPVLELANTQNTTKNNTGIGNLYLQYSPVSWIDIRSTFSPSVNFSKSGLFWGALSQERQLTTPAGQASNSQSLGYIFDNMLTINKSIKAHSFAFTGLYSVQDQQYESLFARVDDLPFNSGWYNLGSSINRTDTRSSYYRYSNVSYMGRINYSYNNKYLLTLANRWDGSSKLATGHKWSSFPSAAIAWKISKESFLENVSFISDLKVRFSAGISGNNNNIDVYETQSTLGNPALYNFGSNPVTGYSPNRLANSQLTWERTREYNLGVDYSLFKSRIMGSIDVYDKLSHGLLLNRNIPVESGWSFIKDNVGSVSNKGIELSLKTINVATQDFTWSTSFSFARNINAIQELLGKKQDLPANAWFIGKPVDVFYNYVLDGVWQEKDAAEAAKYSQLPGQARVKDLNHDGKISAPDDYAIIGHADPTWIGGFSTQLSYKRFDLSASLFTRQGQTIFSVFNQNFLRYDGLTNYQFLKGQYYMPPNDVNAGMASNYYPQPNNPGPYWRRLDPIVGASFVKVQNIALGYTLPYALLQRAQIKALRVYINVLNPFVFTNYKGFDPETDGTASTLNNTGVSSITYQFGLNLKF